MTQDKSNDKFKLWAFLVMFLGPLGIAITFLTKNHNNDYVTHYMKQVFTFSVALSAASVPVIVPLLGLLWAIVIGLVALILWVIGWIYALSGQKKELPVIGHYAKELFKGF